MDDILGGSELPQRIMDSISGSYKLTDGSVEPPDLYLGADVKKWYIPDSEEPDKVIWATSSTK